MKHHKKVLLLCLSSSFLLFVIGCSIFPKEETTLAPPLVEPATTQIATAEVKQGTIEKTLTGFGTFEPTHMTYHQFTQSSGRVEEVFFRAGDQVKEEDILLRLDDKGLEFEVKVKEIELERKIIELNEVKKTGNQQRIRLAELEKNLAQMQYEAVKEELVSTELKAQMDGVIVFDGNIKAGDEISKYQILFTVADTSQLRLAFSASSLADLKDVSIGMMAEVEFRDKIYEGKVVQTPETAPNVDDEKLQEEYVEQLYIQITDAPDDITIGEQASITIVLDKKENVLVIPKRGLREEIGSNQPYVQLLEGEGRSERDVEIGIESSTEVEIIEGLEVGEQVIMK